MSSNNNKQSSSSFEKPNEKKASTIIENCIDNFCIQQKESYIDGTSDCCNSEVGYSESNGNRPTCYNCNKWCKATYKYCGNCILKLKVQELIAEGKYLNEKKRDLLKELEVVKNEIVINDTELGKTCKHDFHVNVYDDGGHGSKEYICKICHYTK